MEGIEIAREPFGAIGSFIGRILHGCHRNVL